MIASFDKLIVYDVCSIKTNTTAVIEYLYFTNLKLFLFCSKKTFILTVKEHCGTQRLYNFDSVFKMLLSVANK